MRDMKDSGVEWLGKIPNHWMIQRIKNLFELRNERNYEALEDVNLISLYTDKGVVQHSDLTETTGNKAVTADGYKIVQENDIVVNIILCWMGAVGRSDYNGVTSPAYDVYKPLSDTNSKYYHYLFRTSQFNGECYCYGRGIMLMRWRTYSTEFKAISIPVPPVKEQQRIVELLDKKVNDVDRLIGNVQKQIEKLKSYKQSLITEVVTKGLDSTVPMRDSGVDWIGKMPMSWCLIRLKYLLSVKSGDAIRNELLSDEGTVPVYGGGEMIGYTFNANVPEESILIGRVGARCGCITLPKGMAWATDNALIVNSTVNRKYLYYLLMASDLNRLNTSNAQPLITGGKIRGAIVPFTVIDSEQLEIVNYLDDKCKCIDGLIAIKQSKIEKLEQYKRSIIYEYVTGKKEVS